MLTLTVITIDRFINIALSFQVIKLGLRKLQIILAGLWTAALILCIAPYFDSSYFGHFYGQSEMCLPLPIASKRQTKVMYGDYNFTTKWFNPVQDISIFHSGWAYSVFVFVGINGASFLLILILYIWMFVSVKKTRAGVNCTKLKNDLRLARKMLLIVVTDACCWIPVIALGIYSLQGNTLPQRVSRLSL